MNSIGIRRISLALVIGLAMLVVSLALIGLSPAPAQAADTSQTEDPVEGAINKPGQLPPEQITSQPYLTLTDVLQAPQQTVDLDGDGRDEAWFRAVRVWISPDDGLALGTLALVDAEQASYEFGADWGRVILDDDGAPSSIALVGEGQKTTLAGKIQPFTYAAVIRRGAGVRASEKPFVFDGAFSYAIVATMGASSEAFSFEAKGRIITIPQEQGDEEGED
jgi:hypothetical protein